MEQFHGTTIVSARRGSARGAGRRRPGHAGQRRRQSERAQSPAPVSTTRYSRDSPAGPPTRLRCSSASKPSSKSIRATCCARRSNWPRTGAPTACCAGSKRCCRGGPRSYADHHRQRRRARARTRPRRDRLRRPVCAGGRQGAAGKHASCAEEIVKKALTIAGDLCIYTNQQHMIETLE